MAGPVRLLVVRPEDHEAVKATAERESVTIADVVSVMLKIYNRAELQTAMRSREELTGWFAEYRAAAKAKRRAKACKASGSRRSIK